MSDAPRKGSLLVIFLTIFIDLLGFGIVLPLLPIYGEDFARDYGLSEHQVGWVIGLLMSSFSAMQFLFLPVWGRLSDRFGRRPIILIGLTASTVFYGMFGLAARYHSLVGLFLTRIGAGIAGATISTAQAYIADTTTKEKRAKGMALIGAAFALGFTLGPMIGAGALFLGRQIAESPWPGYVASLMSASALLLAFVKLPESLRPESGVRARRTLFDAAALRAALSIPSLGLLLFTSAIAVFSFANFESTLSVQIDRLAMQATADEAPLLSRLASQIKDSGYEREEDIALIVICAVFAYLGIILTLAQGVLVRRLADKISEGTMATVGAISAVAGFAMLAAATSCGSFELLMAAMAVEVLGFAFVNPSLQSLISRRSDPGQQGGILGLAQSATSLARILGPVFGLRLFKQSPEYPYYGAAGLMALALLLIIVCVRSGHDFVPAEGDQAP